MISRAERSAVSPLVMGAATTPNSASMLMKLASSKGAVEVSHDDALDRGFEELANWSMPEYDRLYIIDDFILVCLPKDGGPYA